MWLLTERSAWRSKRAAPGISANHIVSIYIVSTVLPTTATSHTTWAYTLGIKISSNHSYISPSFRMSQKPAIRHRQ